MKDIRVEEHIVKVGDKEIYGKIYRPAEDGRYPAIILSHGYNGCNDDFERECRYYAEHGYLAYAYDFCGGSTRSKSSGMSTDMTIFTEKQDLLDVIESITSHHSVDKDRVFLMGGSQGGLVTSLVAEEVDSLVKGMILYYPAFNIPDDWRRNYKTVDDIPQEQNFWGLTLSKNFFVAMRDYYTFDNIGKFSKDVLIIHGDKDEIVIIENSKRAIELYDNAKLVVLKGEGHGYTDEGGAKAMGLVLEFMDEHL